MKTTIIITIPKKEEARLNAQIQKIYREYSQYRTRGSKDGVWRNIPHVTLLHLGDMAEVPKEVFDRLQQALAKQRQFKVKITGLEARDAGEKGFHIVLKAQKTKAIDKLHRKVFDAQRHLIVGEPRYALENFYPHCSVITNIPKEKKDEIMRKIKLKKMQFTAREVAVKTLEGGKPAQVLSRHRFGTQRARRRR